MIVIMLQNTALEKNLINGHARDLHVAHFGIIPSGTSAIVYRWKHIEKEYANESLQKTLPTYYQIEIAMDWTVNLSRKIA